jgi:lipopolysaccharide transport system ATP-binding protein
MSTPIIEVRDLSKRYRLGTIGAESVRDEFGLFLARFHSKKSKEPPIVRTPKTIWALKNINFNVQPGEVLGIIGSNGAGKSTLLKILSRITEPTKGEAVLRGRAASLLEVGTGFHPDLTGRENIFLNAAILGMRKEETKRKLADIIAFSEIEAFIETPVKRYSSGMRVRLAFAVAAFLDPEILIMDEVLAVGDESFQKKCLGKMSDVATAGRTILFVSHDLAAVQNLCGRVIVLRKGEIFADDQPAEAIRKYLAEIPAFTEHLDEEELPCGQGARIVSVSISQGPGTVENLLRSGNPAHLSVYLRRMTTGTWCVLEIYNEMGAMISRITSKGTRHEGESLLLTCVMDPLLLIPGHYRLAGMVIFQDEVQHYIENLGSFRVNPGSIDGQRISNRRASGLVHLPHRWQAYEVQSDALGTSRERLDLGTSTTSNP